MTTLLLPIISTNEPKKNYILSIRCPFLTTTFAICHSFDRRPKGLNVRQYTQFLEDAPSLRIVCVCVWVSAMISAPITELILDRVSYGTLG